MSVYNNLQEIIKFTRNKKTGMWEVTLKTQKSEAAKKNSGTNIKTRNITVFTCRTVQPNYIKYPQGHQTIFLEDVARPN